MRNRQRTKGEKYIKRQWRKREKDIEILIQRRQRRNRREKIQNGQKR